MSKRHFIVGFETVAILELDQAVIDVVDDEWRKYLYDFNHPVEIAEMIARNMMEHGWSLSQLDGWADLPDDNAVFIEGPEWKAVQVVEINPTMLAELQQKMGDGHSC